MNAAEIRAELLTMALRGICERFGVRFDSDADAPPELAGMLERFAHAYATAENDADTADVVVYPPAGAFTP